MYNIIVIDWRLNMSHNSLVEFREWTVSIIIAIIIAFILKAFLFDITQVSGTSMLPNLHNLDRIAIEKVCLISKNFTRGEIVILDPGPKGQKLTYIKRIVGLPGETVQIRNGLVYINSKLLPEKYLAKNTLTFPNMLIKVPSDAVFVLGDNRNVSEDSRYLGPIPINNLKGHAIFRAYPFSDIKIF